MQMPQKTLRLLRLESVITLIDSKLHEQLGYTLNFDYYHEPEFQTCCLLYLWNNFTGKDTGDANYYLSISTMQWLKIFGHNSDGTIEDRRAFVMELIAEEKINPVALISEPV